MSASTGRRRLLWFGGGVFVTLVLVCGGTLFGLWWVLSGLFITPPNPTNEPDVVHTLPGGFPQCVAFSPDGSLLAVGTPTVLYPDPPTLTVYDVTTGAKTFSAAGTRWILAVAFAPDGRHLVVGLGAADAQPDAAEVVVYAVPGFREVYRGLPAPDCRPDRLAFVPDLPLLFAFRADPPFDPSGVTAHTFPDLTPGPTFPVRMSNPQCVTTTPTDTVLIGGRTKDFTPEVERFDRLGKPLGKFAFPIGSTGAVVALLRKPAAKAVTAVTHSGTQDFDPESGQPTGAFTPFASPDEGVIAATADGRQVATGSEVRSSLAPDFRPWYAKGAFLRVTDLSTGADRKWWVGARGPVAFSPDGRQVAAGFTDLSAGAPGRTAGVRVWVSP